MHDVLRQEHPLAALVVVLIIKRDGAEAGARSDAVGGDRGRCWVFMWLSTFIVVIICFNSMWNIDICDRELFDAESNSMN